MKKEGQELIGPSSDLMSQDWKRNLTSKMSEGLLPGLGMQIYRIYERSVDIKNYSFSHGPRFTPMGPRNPQLNYAVDKPNERAD